MRNYLQGSMYISAHRTHWGAIELRLACVGLLEQTTKAAKPVEFEAINDGDMTEPTMVFGPAEAQQLMEELWRAGIRPASGEGSIGQLGATEKHLADMRAIAFHKLGLGEKG
jgi:hypothetical protein